jgi:hypothetical protein
MGVVKGLACKSRQIGLGLVKACRVIRGRSCPRKRTWKFADEIHGLTLCCFLINGPSILGSFLSVLRQGKRGHRFGAIDRGEIQSWTGSPGHLLMSGVKQRGRGCGMRELRIRPGQP